MPFLIEPLQSCNDAWAGAASEPFNVTQSREAGAGRLVARAHRLPIHDHRRFADVASDLLARGYAVRFRAGGGSMAPAIGDGDVITVTPIAAANLIPGRVIVYRDRHRIFAHRIVHIADRRARCEHLIVRGDAVRDCDPPVAPSQVLGEVTAVARSGAPGGVGALDGVRSLVSRVRQRTDKLFQFR
jgi:hypothetical protein